MNICLQCYFHIELQNSTGYTPYQLVYGLHPLMLTKCIVHVASGNGRDNIIVKVLIGKIKELEKLQEARM